MNEQAVRRDWFYGFIVLLIAIHIPVDALLVWDFVTHPLTPDFQHGSIAFRLVVMLIMVPVVIVVAVLVNRRAPGNVTGLFLLLWITGALELTARPEIQILHEVAIDWVGIWFLPLFFPDGRAFPRRFERSIRFLCVGLVLSVVLFSISSPYSFSIQLANPLYIPAFSSLFDLVSTIEPLLLLATLMTLILSLVARYRGSSQGVRQQMKWLLWVTLSIIVVLIPAVVTGIVTRDPQTYSPLESLISAIENIYIPLAPFVAISIAILRHKLYDIDIIIRRTLIYSILTAVLGVIYFGGVVLAQQVFRATTGETPDLAIVVSTLLIAALFSPLRRRIQQTIDRRFYRRKYNAELTLARFNQSLRDDVDMETLQTHLVAVVQATMQPDQMALWINGQRDVQS